MNLKETQVVRNALRAVEPKSKCTRCDSTDTFVDEEGRQPLCATHLNELVAYLLQEQ